MLAALLVPALLALAQAPIKPEKHPELGLEFPRPATYQPVPTQPTEREVCLYFVDGAKPKARRTSSAYDDDPTRALLLVLWFEPAAPAIAGAAPLTADGLHSDLRGWVSDRLPRWNLRPTNERPGKKGWTAQEYEIQPRGGGGLKGWGFEWKGADRTIAFVGIAPYDAFTRQRESWLRAAQGCVFSEPREPSMAEVERRYARAGFREVEQRIAVRRKLLRGWGAEDTDDYLVVHHTQDLAMVRRVMTNLQIVRAEYARLFPPARPITAVAVVRICRDRDEYLAYGGPDGSAGYWSPSARELVLYDAEKDPENRGNGDAATFLALYHEAFHQFVHYAAGEVAPHSWFDEGWGDYFSGARVQGGNLVGIDPHPWRVELARDAVAAGATVPFADLLRLEQPQFYADEVVGLCYAQAWSFVWFPRRSERVAADPAWSGLLERYYTALRDAWTVEAPALERDTAQAADPAKPGAARSDAAARDAARARSRERALAAALEGVDVAALESAWKDFVRTSK